MDNFYENLNLVYPEIAITVEDFNLGNSSAKFYIPVIMPLVGSSDKTVRTGMPSGSNILNKSKPSLSKNANTSGFINIPIHSERMGSWKDNIVRKGSQFIVIFIGGDIAKPRILGRY